MLFLYFRICFSCASVIRTPGTLGCTVDGGFSTAAAVVEEDGAAATVDGLLDVGVAIPTIGVIFEQSAKCTQP